MFVRRCVCVSEGVYVCQEVCMSVRRCVCVSGGVYVCQEVCMCQEPGL